jgi:hypothetical protein
VGNFQGDSRLAMGITGAEEAVRVLGLVSGAAPLPQHSQSETARRSCQRIMEAANPDGEECERVGEGYLAVGDRPKGKNNRGGRAIA